MIVGLGDPFEVETWIRPYFAKKKLKEYHELYWGRLLQELVWASSLVARQSVSALSKTYVCHTCRTLYHEHGECAATVFCKWQIHSFYPRRLELSCPFFYPMVCVVCFVLIVASFRLCLYLGLNKIWCCVDVQVVHQQTSWWLKTKNGCRFLWRRESAATWTRHKTTSRLRTQNSYMGVYSYTNTWKKSAFSYTNRERVQNLDKVRTFLASKALSCMQHN